MADTVPAPASVSATAVATAVSSSAGKPQSSYGAHDPSKPAVKRQIVCFSFYKVMPEWRRLPAEEKAAHKAAFAEVLTKWNKPGEFVSLTYSTIGTRGVVDMCVWSIGYGVDELDVIGSELMRPPLGVLPPSPPTFLAISNRSHNQTAPPRQR